MSLKLNQDARNFLQNRLKEHGYVEKSNDEQNYKSIVGNGFQKKTTVPYDTRPSLPQVKSAVGDVKKFVAKANTNTKKEIIMPPKASDNKPKSNSYMYNQESNAPKLPQVKSAVSDVKKFVKNDSNTLKSSGTPMRNSSGNLTTKKRDMSNDAIVSKDSFKKGQSFGDKIVGGTYDITHNKLPKQSKAFVKGTTEVFSNPIQRAAYEIKQALGKIPAFRIKDRSVYNHGNTGEYLSLMGKYNKSKEGGEKLTDKEFERLNFLANEEDRINRQYVGLRMNGTDDDWKEVQTAEQLGSFTGEMFKLWLYSKIFGSITSGTGLASNAGKIGKTIEGLLASTGSFAASGATSAYGQGASGNQIAKETIKSGVLGATSGIISNVVRAGGTKLLSRAGISTDLIFGNQAARIGLNIGSNVAGMEAGTYVSSKITGDEATLNDYLSAAMMAVVFGVYGELKTQMSRNPETGKTMFSTIRENRANSNKAVELYKKISLQKYDVLFRKYMSEPNAKTYNDLINYINTEISRLESIAISNASGTEFVTSKGGKALKSLYQDYLILKNVLPSNNASSFVQTSGVKMPPSTVKNTNVIMPPTAEEYKAMTEKNVKFPPKATEQNIDIKTPPSTEVVKNGPVKSADVKSAIERIVNGTATNKDIDLFKPANVQNRAMFEETTGVKLPSTNSEVRHYLRNFAQNQTVGTVNVKTDNLTMPGVENVPNVQNSVDMHNVNSAPTLEVQDAQIYNIATSNLIRRARENNLDLQTFYAETENVDAYNLTEQDIQTINNAFAKLFGNNVDDNIQGNLNILSKIANKYPVNVISPQQTETASEGQNQAGQVNPQKPSTEKSVQNIIDEGQETNIEFEKDFNDYPYNMKTVIKDYITYSNPNISDFAERVISGKSLPKEKLYLNPVTSRAVNDIKDILGIDVSGYKVSMDSNAVRHIVKRHGANGKADDSMSNLSDWEKIQYVLENYDNVEYGGKASGYTTVKENGKTRLADSVLYSKKINGTFYVVEAVPVTNAKALNIVTAYINKNGAMQVSDVKNPKETSETPSAYTPYDNNIPQSSNIVNNQYMQNVENDAGQDESIIGQNNVSSFEDFKETVLERYPNMPEDNIREAYNKFYGLTDETGNDIINNNEVYYQRSEKDAEQQGRDNGDGYKQSGSQAESSNTVRTEGYKFRNGQEYRKTKAGLWDKTYGRVRGTAKKTTRKFIETHNSTITFKEYDNIPTVKEYFKNTYNRDIHFAEGPIYDISAVVKNAEPFEADGVYVGGNIIVRLSKDTETDVVHEMVHEGQNDPEYSNITNSIMTLFDKGKIDGYIIAKKEYYKEAYGNRGNLDEDIAREAYADIISQLATKGGISAEPVKSLFPDTESYEKARELAEDYVVYLINNPPKNEASLKIEGAFSMSENTGKPYFALKENEAEKALAFMEKNYGEMYRNLIKEHGKINPGESPRIDVEVPKKSADGRYVSRHARTIAEAGGMSEELHSEFEKMIVDGDLSYDEITDKRAVQHANEVIEQAGSFDNAIGRWDAISNNSKIGKYDIALGQKLYTMAREQGDNATAARIMIDLVTNVSNAAQALQSARMLKQMGPDGRLYAFEKYVDRINKYQQKKYKGKKPDVKIDPKLAENALNAKGEEAQEKAYEAIEKNIAEQLPSTWGDKTHALRYTAMLFNPKTHIKNMGGNGIMFIARHVKDGIGGLLENSLRLPKEQRTKPLPFHRTKDSKEFARTDWNKVKAVYEGETNRYDIDTSSINKDRKIFTSKAFGWLEAIRKFASNTLEAEDVLWGRLNYVDVFSHAMSARGYTSDFLNSGTPEANKALNELRLYSLEQAQKATFRDASKLAETLTSVRKTLGKNAVSNFTFGVGVDAATPFVKTPINMIRRGTEYSPVGFVTSTAAKACQDVINGIEEDFRNDDGNISVKSIAKGVGNVAKGLKEGKFDAATFIDNLSANLLGTGLMAIGIWAAISGILTASGDEDDDAESFKKSVGEEQTYSLRFGDFSYSIDWVMPISLPFFIGGELGLTMRKNNDTEKFNDYMDALSRVADPLLEQTMLSGLENVLSAPKYADRNTPAAVAVLAEIYSTFGSQFIPSLFGAMARTIDGTKRNVYYDDKTDGGWSWADEQKNEAFAKLPFISKTLEPSINEWGEEESRGNFAERFFENFISPGNIEISKATKTDKALIELYEKTGESIVIPKNAPASFTYDGKTIELSAENYTKFAKERGRTAYKYVAELVDSSNYKNLSDDLKVDVISDLYAYSTKLSQTKVSDYKLEREYQKVFEAENAGISPAIYYIADNCTNGIIGDKSASGKTIPNSATRKEFKEIKKNVTGLSEAQKIKLLKIMGYSDNQIKMFKYNLPN